ncbi:MAG: hypothetical protein COA71_13150 [SAR86 cluster bacterium]|uniref:HTH marR-type domain-containing protein n=1 Tax=SAR86 cluster bacterium TaxID=2030880 RepID=A0A2A5C8X1_9GAMM|nr:MAG: hypothetical protein COA71_13150 [SAR86 cluster bacterium]
MKNKKIDNEVMEFVRELLTVITISKHWATSKIPIDGLSQARMLILMYLRDTGSSPMRGLNKHLGTSATNVTGLVDGLELEGLVVRKPDSIDRRVTKILITETGKRKVQEEWFKYETSCASTFIDIEPAKRRGILKALKELRQQIEK